LRDVKGQQEFEGSTQREFSQHEHVLTEAEQQGQQQGVKQRQGLDRGRGRGRGLTRARGEEQRSERAVTPPFIQTDAGLFAAFQGAETAKSKLFEQCKITVWALQFTVGRLFRVICRPLNCLLHLGTFYTSATLMQAKRHYTGKAWGFSYTCHTS